ncbi:MAG: hypothetical protein IPI39_14300 [Candidatus Obscuribacter sp.]|nr:hypothetical protein [Candidatus Obscuribacter sp.]
MAAYPLVSFLTANFAQGNRNLLRTVYRASTLAALVTLSSTVVYAQDKSALTSLNEKAREFYAQARERAINESKPLILCYSDRIVLITNDKREEFKDIPDNYHVLKTVDHIALGLYSLLNHQEGKAVSESDKKTLIDFKPIIAKARAALTECGLSQPVVERQYRMIDNSIAFIDESLKTNNLDLTSYCRKLAPDLLQNAYEAVSLQLAEIDKAVTKWHAEMPKSDWEKTKVIIVGGHMPRQQNSNLQYFNKLFNVKVEGEKVMYMEGLSEEKDAINLVGTHVLDEGVAVAFFKDPWRMHRDLLSDGAARYLKEHPPLTSKTDKGQ